MESQGAKYRHADGRVLFVDGGGSEPYMTIYLKPWKSGQGYRRCRFVVKMLPLRRTREEAQADLDDFAQQRGMEVVN